MKIKAGMEGKFATCCENNSKDGYSKCALDYMIRWAELMEKEIDESSEPPEKVITERAEALSHEADTEGITGFMYGWVVNALSALWVHGEALRVWHNAQYGVEDSTGTVNPAILTVGGAS